MKNGQYAMPDRKCTYCLALFLSATIAVAHARAKFEPPAVVLPEGAIACLGDVRLTHFGSVECVAFSSDGKLLASYGRDEVLRIWDVATGLEKRRRTEVPCTPRRIAWSPDGKLLAFAGDDAVEVFILDAETLKKVHKFETYVNRAGPGTVFAFAPNSRLFAWWSRDGLLRVYDLKEKEEVRRWHSLETQPLLAFSPDSKQLAYTNGNTTAVESIWETAEALENKDKNAVPSALAFSPDGTLLAIGAGRHVRLLELAKGKDQSAGPQHAAPVQCVVFSPDGKFLYSTAGDGGVQGVGRSGWQVDPAFRSASQN